MKTEPCEPCEWAGIDTVAEHFVGWDQMPLCDMHFELDKQGRLGNWINENVDFSNEGEAIDVPEPTVVQSGTIKMKVPKEVQRKLLNMGFPEEMGDDKIDGLLFGSFDSFPENQQPLPNHLMEHPEPETTVDDVLSTLESDAWAHLKGAGEGSVTNLVITQYIVEFLRGYDRDISNLEFSLEQINLRKNG